MALLCDWILFWQTLICFEVFRFLHSTIICKFLDKSFSFSLFSLFVVLTWHKSALNRFGENVGQPALPEKTIWLPILKKGHIISLMAYRITLPWQWNYDALGWRILFLLFFIKKNVNANLVLSRMYFFVLSVVSCMCGPNCDGATGFWEPGWKYKKEVLKFEHKVSIQF